MMRSSFSSLALICWHNLLQCRLTREPRCEHMCVSIYISCDTYLQGNLIANTPTHTRRPVLIQATMQLLNPNADNPETSASGYNNKLTELLTARRQLPVNEQRGPACSWTER